MEMKKKKVAQAPKQNGRPANNDELKVQQGQFGLSRRGIVECSFIC